MNTAYAEAGPAQNDPLGLAGRERASRRALDETI